MIVYFVRVDVFTFGAAILTDAFLCALAEGCANILHSSYQQLAKKVKLKLFYSVCSVHLIMGVTVCGNC